MASYPAINDTEQVLWMKIANNMYAYAVAQGQTGLTAPSWNDDEFALVKKTDYYLAALNPVP